MTAVFGAVVIVASGVLAGCGGSGQERSLIRSFFTASRVNDRATLGNIAMVSFDAREQGTVSTFDVESVGEEQRRPLRMRELRQAVTEAEQAQQTFAANMRAYQDEYLDGIARVIEAERAGDAVASRDREVQEAWAQWREESQENSRMVSEAQAALSAESAVAQVSAFDPTNPIDVQALGGQLLTKEVTITASVERDDSSEERTMIFTLQKVELGSGEDMVDGRWIVSDIS